MTQGGFAGNVLQVDLTNGTAAIEPLDPVIARDYIGGLGTAIKIAWDNITPGTEPLSPDNPVVLAAGPLVGTGVPASSRVYAVTRLPESRAVGWCGGGGVTFGCRLKNAGFDHVVIKGRASGPVYLYLSDGRAEIRSADHLWGTGTAQCFQALSEEIGQVGAITIGRAGENLAAFSMAYVDGFSTMGRGGLAAVLGSKNLKAIVAKGSFGVRVADKKAYKQLCNTLLMKIHEYPHLKEWQDLGLVKSLPLVPREVYQRIKKRRVACVSCPIGDKDVIEIEDGEYKGTMACSSSAVNLFTPMIYGMQDYREAVKLVSELDEYGLDMFEFFGLMGFAKTLMDKGLIPEDEDEIRLDSLGSMLAWAGKISLRQGLGEVLAGSFRRVFQELGDDARRHAPALIKGMHPYVGPDAALKWNLFGTMELGQVMDPRGPHVGASGSPTYFAKRPIEVFPRHLQRMGVPGEAIERILGKGSDSEGEELKVGALLKYSQSWFTTLGSMGVCARAQINRFYNAKLCAELYQAVTGIETDLALLRERVERVWTLLRMANVREGFARRDDFLPHEWFGEKGFKEYLSEKPVTRDEVKKMIEDYYNEWGWDPRTGAPRDDTLSRLGLS